MHVFDDEDLQFAVDTRMCPMVAAQGALAFFTVAELCRHSLLFGDPLVTLSARNYSACCMPMKGIR
jgi:hypothetical protein